MASEEPRLYKWFEQAARANNIVKPVSSEESKSKRWTDWFEQSQPAYIAHVNYGPCLIRAQRREGRTEMSPGRIFYLVTLVTAVEDAKMKEMRQGYFQVPSMVSLEDKDGNMHMLKMVYELSMLITEFVITRPQESSNVTVYDGKRYTKMLLSELRQHIDVERSEEYRIAFDAFKQSNPDFMRDHDVGSAVVLTPAADARLIMSHLPHEERSADMRYALAPPFLRHAMERNDERKGRAPIDARCAEPLHDPHGVVTHLRRK